MNYCDLVKILCDLIIKCAKGTNITYLIIIFYNFISSKNYLFDLKERTNIINYKVIKSFAACKFGKYG
jgi:hypothetical protein